LAQQETVISVSIVPISPPAVVDFDALLRDPTHPTQLRPDFDSGDHLHVNDAGYIAEAMAIPLSLFGR